MASVPYLNESAYIGKTLGYVVCHDIFVMMHKPTPAGAEDWQETLRAIRSSSSAKWFVYAEGTSLTATQREALNEFYKDFGPGFRTSLLTDSMITRGMITALRWMLRDHPIRTFSLSDFDGAMLYLGLKSGSLQTRKLIESTSALASQLGVSLPAWGSSTQSDSRMAQCL